MIVILLCISREELTEIQIEKDLNQNIQQHNSERNFTNKRFSVYVDRSINTITIEDF